MGNYWVVLVPVIEGEGVFAAPIGTIHVGSGPEVLVTAGAEETARDLVEEFVEIVLEGPHDIRSLGLAEELPDGTRMHNLAANGFLCLPADKRPVLRLSAREVSRIRAEFAASDRLAQKSKPPSDPG